MITSDVISDMFSPHFEVHATTATTKGCNTQVKEKGALFE